MLNHKSILLIIIACLIIPVSPTMASKVTYYPAELGHPAYNVYNLGFESFPLGQETEFSESIGDFIVTYSSPNDSDAFTVEQNWLLGEAGSSILGISFNRSVFGILLYYVTLESDPFQIDLQMDLISGGLDGDIVEPIVESGTILPGLYYFGLFNRLPVCVCNNYFDAVMLSDFTTPNFGVLGGITVVENLPEPPVLATFGIGLIILIVLRRPKLELFIKYKKTIIKQLNLC